MTRWIVLLVAAVVLTLCGNASASCTTTVYDFNGKIVTCMSCCFGNNCTVTCTP